MSDYLIREIETAPNVTVSYRARRTGTEGTRTSSGSSPTELPGFGRVATTCRRETGRGGKAPPPVHQAAVLLALRCVAVKLWRCSGASWTGGPGRWV